jgi:hypothetical protein
VAADAPRAASGEGETGDDPFEVRGECDPVVVLRPLALSLLAGSGWLLGLGRCTVPAICRAFLCLLRLSVVWPP